VLRPVGSFIPFGEREHIFLIQANVIWGPVDPEDHQRGEMVISVTLFGETESNTGKKHVTCHVHAYSMEIFTHLNQTNNKMLCKQMMLDLRTLTLIL